LRRSLSRLSKLFRGADRVRPARKAPRLQLESLGDRTLPAILFTPQVTNPVVTDGAGDVLENAPVYLIYWGSAWGQPGNNPTRQQIDSAVSSLVSSAYLSSLSQYRGG